MRTADAVVESLIRHGIDTLYALPGVHNDHLFDAAPVSYTHLTLPTICSV